MDKIQARLLKGFRDFPPEKQQKRLKCIETLQKVFENFGFAPIDTPILEYEDILLGKGGGETEKQVYRFEDNGARNVAMRFDLTVPFARYISMYKHEIPIPFARYQIGKVFRGENTQKGRYREFMQCDFDIIGVDHVSSDVTILQTIIASFEALQMENIKVHISHRGILNEFLSTYKPRGFTAQEALTETLRIIDKLRKIGTEKTRELLAEIWDADVCEAIVKFGNKEKNNEDTLQALTKLLPHNPIDLQRLQTIYQMTQTLGIENKVVIDPSITRGLDYYTGFVCETFVVGHEDIGSVCSGGRYNDLTKMFDDESFPGVGASVGLDRLMSILESQQEQKNDDYEPVVVIMPQDEKALTYCHQLLPTLHKNAISGQVYPFASNMKSFFKYTEKIKADFACIVGTEELQSNTVTVKDQATREQKSKVTIEEAIQWIQSLK